MTVIFWRRRRDSVSGLDAPRSSAALDSPPDCRFTAAPLRILSRYQNKKAGTSPAFLFWRRRRDSNPRTAFDGYTISNRAPSTRLGDSSKYLFLCRLSRTASYYIIENLVCQDIFLHFFVFLLFLFTYSIDFLFVLVYNSYWFCMASHERC